MTDSVMVPPSQNEAWGFWNTMGECAIDAWPVAMTHIARATGQSLESVRVFLDSRYGRHFADTVQDRLCRGDSLPEAINRTTEQWIAWRISRTISKDYGIPRGLPYLTGLVMHCDIVEELGAA